MYGDGPYTSPAGRWTRPAGKTQKRDRSNVSIPDRSRITEQDVLEALIRAGYPTKRKGGENHGGCPLCGKGDDRLRVHILNGILITRCRICGADGPTIWKHLGLLGTGAGAEPPHKVQIGECVWTCVDPETGKTYIHDRRDFLTGVEAKASKTITWRGGLGGLSSKRLIYVAHNSDSAAVVVVEGEKAADALARILAPFVEWLVLGTVQGAPTVPDLSALASLKGRKVILWSDHDEPGRAQMAGIHDLICINHAADVKMVDPARLGADSSGWDAADWQPAAEPVPQLMAALCSLPALMGRPATLADTEIDFGRPIGPLSTPSDSTDWLQAFRPLSEMGEAQPTTEPLARMLGWPKRVTAAHGPAGSGKTRILAAAAAAVSTDAQWLGMPVVAGKVLWIALEDEDGAKQLLRRHGANLDNVIVGPGHVLTMAGEKQWSKRLLQLVDHFKPVWVILDSLPQLAAALGIDTNNADDVTRALQPLTVAASQTGCAVTITHHEPHAEKRLRNSTAIAAAVDAIVRVSHVETVTTIQAGSKMRYGTRHDQQVYARLVDEDRFEASEAAPAASDTGRAGPQTGMDGPAAVSDMEAYDRVLGALVKIGDWETTTQIVKTVGAKKSRVLTALDQLIAAGRTETRPGAGKSTLYRVVPGCSPPTPGEVGNNVVPDCSAPVPVGREQRCSPVPDPIEGTTRGNTLDSLGQREQPEPDPAGSTEAPPVDPRPENQGPSPPPDAPAGFLEAPPPDGETATPSGVDGAAPILWRPDWKPSLNRADSGEPGRCALCPVPLPAGYRFTICTSCARDVQAFINGETGIGSDGKPTDPSPIAEPVRRATYIAVDPRRLAAKAAGREPTAQELREWMGLESAS